VITLNNLEIQTLFAQALLGDYEGDDAWTAISALQQNGSHEVFDYAAAWCLVRRSVEESASGNDPVSASTRAFN
jgi:hypothetical protein